MNHGSDWVEYRSARGLPYWIREAQMPRISDEFIESVFYIYPSEEAAERSEAVGGTGFLVSIPCKADPREEFVYAVTNKHLITDDFPVLRVNTKDGLVDRMKTKRTDWVSADEDDLSVMEIGLSEKHQYNTIRDDLFVTREDLAPNDTGPDIGPGDDVFMVGRFINRDGREQNSPSVRFGNISIMHQEKVSHRDGYLQENISVEMRSIGGYSGSPVLVFISPFAIRPRETSMSGSLRQWLLGVDWGHVPQRARVLTANGTNHPQGCYVEINTAMCNVVPAWQLRALLDTPRLYCKRDEDEDRIREELTAGIKPLPDVLD